MLLDVCYSYRAGLGVKDALAAVCRLRDRGLIAVLHADIEHYFDSVNHALLGEMLQDLAVERELHELLCQWLTIGIVDVDQVGPNKVGLPQGLPISPLLANLYLRPFDQEMLSQGCALVRYADDFLIGCPEASHLEAGVNAT